ncbi:C2 domain-containing protein, partial [Irpex rosettiformis]
MSKELGTLVVVVLKARNLPDDHFYKQDVYTKLTLQGSTKKTGVDVKGGQRPEWDEELRFTVTENATQSAKKLEISCWSKESRQDTLVGKGEVDISDTLRTGEFDDWVPLSTDKGQRGDIYLEMTWFAAGPPPALSRRPSKLKPSERLSRPS